MDGVFHHLMQLKNHPASLTVKSFPWVISCRGHGALIELIKPWRNDRKRIKVRDRSSGAAVKMQFSSYEVVSRTKKRFHRNSNKDGSRPDIP